MKFLHFLGVSFFLLFLVVGSASVQANSLDIDGDGQVEAIQDGLLIFRYLSGQTGDALIEGALSNQATRTRPEDLTLYLEQLGFRLDIDGDGTAEAATDGHLLIRFLLGFRGDKLIDGVVAEGATLTDAASLEAALAALLGPTDLVIPALHAPLIRGENSTIFLSGNHLEGLLVTTSNPGLQVSQLQSSGTLASFELSISAELPPGTYTLTFTTRHGIRTTSVTVLDPSARLMFSPSPAALVVGQTLNLDVWLSQSSLAAQTLTFTVQNSAVASLSPTEITIPAGQTRVSTQLTVQGVAAGATSIQGVSEFLGNLSIPLFVSSQNVRPEAGQPLAIQSALLGVRLVPEEVEVPPLEKNGLQVAIVRVDKRPALETNPLSQPYHANALPLGVVLGASLQSIQPTFLAQGGENYQLSLTGTGLDQVTSAVLYPPDNVTLGLFESRLEGRQGTLSVSVAAEAERGARQLVLTTENDVVQVSLPGKDRLQIVAGAPEIQTISHPLVEVGRGGTLTIIGKNLDQVSSLSISGGRTPQAAVGSESPSQAKQTVSIFGVSPALMTQNSRYTLSISGKNLQEVEHIHLLPGPETALPVARTVPPLTPPKDPSVLLKAPRIFGVSPNQVSLDTVLHLRLSGEHLNRVERVQVHPEEGVMLGSGWWVNRQGTQLTLPVQVQAGATSGQRMITIEGAGFSSSWVASLSNSFMVGEGTWDLRPVTAPVLGVDMGVKDAAPVYFLNEQHIHSSTVWEVNKAGTVLTVEVEVPRGAPVGAYAVQLEAQGVTTSATPFNQNRLTVVEGEDFLMTAFAPMLGVIKAAPKPPPNPAADLHLGSHWQIDESGTVLTVEYWADFGSLPGDRLVTLTSAASGGVSEQVTTSTLTLVDEPEVEHGRAVTAILGVDKDPGPPAERLLPRFAQIAPLGVVVGSAVTAMDRAGVEVGKVTTVTLTGFGLSGVDGVEIIPADGLSMANLLAAADGHSVSFALTVDSEAELTLRQVRLLAAGQVIAPSNVAADHLRVTVPQPHIASISPAVMTVGDEPVTMTIRGENLLNAEQVLLLPAEGVQLSLPVVAADGLSLTLDISVGEEATPGRRALVVQTLSGSTESLAKLTNTLIILAPAVGTPYDALVAPVLGIMKGEEPVVPAPQWSGTISTPPLGVTLLAEPPASTPWDQSLFTFQLGVLKGASVASVEPEVLTVGHEVTLLIKGVDLQTVVDIQLDPATGIRQRGERTLSAEGGQLEVVLAVTADAPLLPRKLRLLRDDGSEVPYSQAQSQSLELVAGFPRVSSVEPVQEKVGQHFAVTIHGAFLHNTQRVSAVPPEGIHFGVEPHVNAEGTQLTLFGYIEPDATPGERVITVTTPAGTSFEGAILDTIFTILSEQEN